MDVREKSISSRDVWNRSSISENLRRNERTPRQQPYLQKRREQRDLQRSGTAVLLDLKHRTLQPLEAVPDGGQKLQRFVGEFDAPARAPEKRNLKVFLQHLDLLADGGGRHVQHLCRGRKIQCRRDGLEDAQRPERQPVVGGRHVKFFLTRCQGLRLLSRRGCSTVSPWDSY